MITTGIVFIHPNDMAALLDGEPRRLRWAALARDVGNILIEEARSAGRLPAA